MGAAAAQTANQLAMANAQEDAGNGILQSTGGAIVDTIKGIGQDTTNTFTGITKRIGEKLANTPSDVANMPLAPGTSPTQVAKQAAAGDLGGLSKSLLNIAGINIQSAVPDGGKAPSRPDLEAKLKNFLSSVRREIATALRHCIEKWLNYLKNKYKILAILLDLEGWIQRQISRLRALIRDWLRKWQERLSVNRAVNYQTSRYRQLISRMIRKLCPKLPSSKYSKRSAAGDFSPSWIRKLQTDPTWSLVDGVTPVNMLANRNAAVAVAIEDPNNTGEIFENNIDYAMNDVVTELQIQQGGYNNYSASDFVDIGESSIISITGTGAAEDSTWRSAGTNAGNALSTTGEDGVYTLDAQNITYWEIFNELANETGYTIYAPKSLLSQRATINITGTIEYIINTLLAARRNIDVNTADKTITIGSVISTIVTLGDNWVPRRGTDGEVANARVTGSGIGSGSGLTDNVVVSIEDTIAALIARFSALGLSTDEIIERIVEMLGESNRDLIAKLVKEMCH
jgi:hypothetical protein